MRIRASATGLLVWLLLVLLAGARAFAQSGAPTKTPAPSTPDQDQAIEAAVRLHDEGKLDEAIAAYQAVLAQNPDNVTALYELAFSYAAKDDFEQSLATARRGVEYQSDVLPLFYDVMGLALDSMGEPRQAIEAYRRGVELVPDASELYYNMAVTYLESLQDEAGGRLALEQAAAADPLHAPTHLLLGQTFQKGGYRSQALLALSTYLLIDPAGRSSLQGYGLWRIVLRGDADDARGSLAPVLPQPAAHADEGDFTAIDQDLAPSHAAALQAQDGGTPEIQALVAQIDRLFARLEARTATGAAFADAHYVPYFVELKQKNFVEPFVYWVCQRAPVTGVGEWLTRNRARVQEFLDWTKAYDWSRP